MILDKIVENKKSQLKKSKEKISIEEMEKIIHSGKMSACIDFKANLIKEGELSIIAEVKKASPSKGVICNNFNHVEIAKTYNECGASAISVLTETDFFMGNDSYLSDIRKDVNIPLLRKDFIIDPWDIYRARVIGADAILLIVAILSKKELIEYIRIAKSLGLSYLVEVHDRAELEIALEIEANIIGINNRNLKTFEVDLKNTEELIKYIPQNIIKVSESGIKSFNDMMYLKEVGANAVLIGETIICDGYTELIKAKFDELRGV